MRMIPAGNEAGVMSAKPVFYLSAQFGGCGGGYRPWQEQASGEWVGVRLGGRKGIKWKVTLKKKRGSSIFDISACGFWRRGYWQ